MTHVMQVAEMALATPKKNVLNSAEPMTGVVLRDTAFVAPVIDNHSIQKLLKMSNLNFWILAFSTNFLVFCLVTLFDRKL